VGLHIGIDKKLGGKMLPKSLKAKIFKQYDLGPYVGGFKDLAQRTMFYVTALHFALTVGLSWSVYVGKMMPIATFLGLIVFSILIAMFVEYKFVLPSTWGFVNRQTYKHFNPLFKKFDKFEKKMDRREKKMDKRLDVMEQMLRDIMEKK